MGYPQKQSKFIERPAQRLELPLGDKKPQVLDNLVSFKQLRITIERLRQQLYDEVLKLSLRSASIPSVAPPPVIIGPNGTAVNNDAFRAIPWTTATSATRALLLLVFSEDTLATHTLSGRTLAAFHDLDRPAELRLDPLKVDDIVHCVRRRCSESRVRAICFSISAKCADIAKRRKQLREQQQQQEQVEEEAKAEKEEEGEYEQSLSCL